MKMSRLLTNAIGSLLLPFAFLLFTLPVAGQTATATLSGTVQDEASAVVPGASVTVVNNGTGARRNATTNADGYFVIPLLPPAAYTVTVERQGFATTQVNDLVLNVADNRSLAVQLQVKSASEVVVVDATAVAVKTTGDGISTTLDQTFVSNLPNNGRSFSSLVLLTPGVTITQAGPEGFGQFSVNGQRTSTNYFTVDGVSANFGIGTTGTENSIALAGGFPAQSAVGGTNSLVSQDALLEFKVQTSGYTAASGRQPGAQVQVITRSGENDFHGSAFNYLRNEALDARNYFNRKPARQTTLRQNFFGGTFAGPLPFLRFGDGGGSIFESGKDRTFFFFSYEGQRLLIPTVADAFVPSLRLRAASVPATRQVLDAFPIPTGPEETTTATCQQPPLPAPPDPTCAPNGRVYSGWAPYALSVSNPTELDATSIRIDHAINAKNTVFGRFNESPSSARFLRLATPFADLQARSTRTLTLGLTSVLSPKMNNEFRINFSRQFAQFSRVANNFEGAIPVDPNLFTNGLGGSGTFFMFFGGRAASFIAGEAASNYQRQFNLVDNLTVMRGNHQLKFGVDYRRLSPTYAPQGIQSAFFFSEAAVKTAIVNSAGVGYTEAARPQFTNISFYGQDTWKPSRRLTLDLGLRYELNPAPTEADGKMPAVVLGITNPPDVSGATLAPAGTPFYKTFYTALAPRFGVAYQLRTRQGQETVLRGGFGVYYDLGSSTAASGFPLRSQKSLPNLAQFPECPTPIPFPLPAACAARLPVVVPTSYPVTSIVFSHSEDLKLPYTLQWNAAIEQSLGREQVLSISYVGSAGRDLFVGQALDSTSLGQPGDNPNFSGIVFTTNGPTSDYHSMQAQYRARLTGGLQALVNYTWSHAIDEVSTDLMTSVLERGNADFDVRHNFNAALHYDVPSVKSNGFIRALTSGWSVDSIVHAQSGAPLNIFSANPLVVNGVFITSRPNLNQGQPLYIADPTVPGGRRFNSAAFSPPPIGQQGSLGRNVMRALPIYQVDMALGRTFKFTELLKLQIKGEVFNIFNHPMFSAYNTQFTSPSFGVPVSTLNARLGGQSELYQLGGPRSIQLSARLSF